jgi:hypothetical protein
MDRHDLQARVCVGIRRGVQRFDACLQGVEVGHVAALVQAIQQVEVHPCVLKIGSRRSCRRSPQTQPCAFNPTT